jgi:response regulator of citrate/malate metabolism
MSDGLDVIIVDDDTAVCKVLLEIIETFYIWGEVHAFTETAKATAYCKSRETGVAIFVLDVYLKDKTGFSFLDTIEDKFPMAHEDTILITGKASDEVVNACLASDISYLLEKPVKPYALQLAIRAIVAKYIKFAKRLLLDTSLAESVSKF